MGTGRRGRAASVAGAGRPVRAVATRRGGRTVSAAGAARPVKAGGTERGGGGSFSSWGRGANQDKGQLQQLGQGGQ